VTALVPVCVVSAALVAVTVIVFGDGRLAGAVYIPFASIVPIVAFPPTTEFTAQVTLPGVVPPDALLLEALRGLPSALIVRPLIVVVVVVPVFVVSPLFVPLDALVPVVLMVVELPDGLLVDAVFIVAEKASWAPARTVALVGATVTLEMAPLSGVLGELSLLVFEPRPEQPLSRKIRSIACVFKRRFTYVPPSGSRLTTLRHANAACKMLFLVVLLLVLLGVGRCCLGVARVENACVSGYWPRGQNEFNGLWFLRPA
jgi:hypothetical protein